MTEEEKKDETSESSEEKSEEKKEDAKSEESTEETKEESTEETKEEATDSKKEIDWKAKHDEEKERADAGEKALADDRYKQDEARRKAEEDAEAEKDKEEDKEPLTKADFQVERAKDRQIMKKQLQTQEAKSIVKGLTDNVDEQDYVLEIHKNRTFPENLSLQEQLEESHAIANKDKWKGERDEALRKAKGDEGANTDAASPHRKPPESKAGEPSMSAEDKQSLVAKGWKWNTTNRRYEKTTGSGVLLYRDPDTGSVKTAK